MKATPESPESELQDLYQSFAAHGMMPLWTQREGLMTVTPQPRAQPALWRWSDLLPLAERAGDLVPVGRGGERRAIGLSNPGIPGEPYATPTLWCAIQYLGPQEKAPAHRHSQTAFRFVVEGEGVWTNVEGDAVAMRRGDLLLTPSWHFHEHHNTTDRAMAWIDGLDIPLISYLDAGFFEFGPDLLGTTATPSSSRSERLWAHPGLRPISRIEDAPVSPLMAYRWEHTDAALTAQLELEAEGQPATASPGHAAIRFTNPTTGKDALRTIRTEMHRTRAGSMFRGQEVGSSIWQIFSGQGVVEIGDKRFEVAQGDIFAVPSWAPFSLAASSDLDAFTFSDAPVYEALGLSRRHQGGDR